MSELLFKPEPLEPDPRFGSKFREFAGPNLRPQVRSKVQAKARSLNLNRTFALYNENENIYTYILKLDKFKAHKDVVALTGA